MSSPRMTAVTEVHDDPTQPEDDPADIFHQRRLRSGPYTEPLPPRMRQVQQRQEQIEEIAPSRYTKLVKDDISSKIMGVPKHVFKVKEVTKFLLFVGAAAGAVLLLDVSAKFLIAVANNSKRQHE